MSEDLNYDWVGAAFKMMHTNSESLAELASAAQLDPLKGDLADVDLSGLDLRGQNFDGWDLRYANFDRAKIAEADFRGATVDAARMTKAEDWQKALVSDDLKMIMHNLYLLQTPISESSISNRIQNVLALGGINRFGDLVTQSEAALLRMPMFGRSSLNEVRQALSKINLKLNMNIFWENKTDSASNKNIVEFSFKEPAPDTLRKRMRSIEFQTLAIYQRDNGIEMHPIIGCRLGKNRSIPFDAVSFDEGIHTLYAVKRLYTFTSANDLIRLAVNRKSIPIIQQSAESNIKVKIVLIFILDFSNKISLPRLPKNSQVSFAIYRQSRTHEKDLSAEKNIYQSDS